MRFKRDSLQKLELRAALAALALLAIVYVGFLGMRPLIIPDETRYAEIPREMLEANAWLAPTFDGMPYFEKPAPAYWAAMVSMKLFGECEFAIRLPYALATLLSALFITLLAKRARKNAPEQDGRDKTEPLICAAVFLSMAEVFAVGTFAVLDSLFTMFLTGVMLCFYCAWTEKESFVKRHLFMLAAGLLAGGAFMVKGFLGVLLPGGAILAFLIWMRDWKACWTLPWAALAGFLGLALPWALAQHAATPDFWRYFIVTEHLGRFIGEGDERHPQPFWFYIPVLLGGMAPFTIFAYSIARGGAKLDWRAPLLRFAAAWTVIPFVALSISSGKLGTYILPLFPALAILIVFCLKENFRNFGWKSFRIALTALFSATFLAIIAIGVYEAIAMISAREFSIQSDFSDYAGLGAVAGVGFLLTLRGRSFSFKLTKFCLAMTAAILAWQICFPQTIEEMKAPGRFIRKNAPKVEAGMRVTASADMAGAVSWTLKRTDVEIFRKPGEFAYGLDKSGRKLLSPDELLDILNAPPEQGVAVFVTKKLFKRTFGDWKGEASRDSFGSFSCLIRPPAKQEPVCK